MLWVIYYMFKMHRIITLTGILHLASLSVAESFDYVIVGAGTAGLLVANRLSANPSITVAVIDPGTDQRSNPNVIDPALWQNNHLSQTNWNYTTIPQVNLSGRAVELQAGLGIGGTSIINGMTMIRGDAPQFDAWERLGNPGWNWNTMYTYMKRVERFFKPSQHVIAAGATYDPAYHGYHGDMHIGFNPTLTPDAIYENFKQSWAELGQSLNQDPNGGYTQGFDLWPQTIDPEKNIRSDAATAYYWPVAESRPNLKLLRGTASHITWATASKDKVPTANGVVYYTPDMQEAHIHATKEVILSAGALRTPLVLERSGVGNPEILHKMGIDVVVANCGVGEHLIDQVNVLLLYQGKSTINGTATYDTFVSARDIYGDDFDSVAVSSKADLPSMAASVAASSNGAMNASALEKIFAIQHDVIFKQRTTAVEIITTTLGDAVGTVCWELLPFWRGSVHLTSAAASDLDKPRVDPRFFSLPFDVDLQVRACRLARSLWSQSPARELVAAAVQPTPQELGPNATDAQWVAYMADKLSSNQHSLGTASMMSRDLGGVVDPRLKVYGTRNVRVVDASVIPMQLSGHLTATIYAVAERVAEFIIADQDGG